MGTSAWIAAQLKPGKDAAIEAKVARLPATQLPTAELLDLYGKTPKEKDKGKDKSPPKDVARELSAAKLLRAIESDRQLEEVLVDFWFNHFNVDTKKGAVKWLAAPYERDAIRAHVFGTFRELLGATAKHPAMLFYLDNWLSSAEALAPKASTKAAPTAPAHGPAAPAKRAPTGAGAKAPDKRTPKKGRGLNENYGRELLELHTLGVDGGYTQADVREVARAFTGWTIDRPQVVGEFVFRPKLHDPGPKTVLGKTIDAGGIGDGEAVLDLLATHPSTAHFIATALARRFVSDDPPKALVDRVAAVFLAEKGDLTKTYEALFSSPELWSATARGEKIKDPFETVVSAVRAVGGTLTLADPADDRGPARAVAPLLQVLDGLGEPPYKCSPPTGYPEIASAWVGTGALVGRIRFAMALTAGKYHVRGAGVDWTPARLVPDGEAPLVDRVARAILHTDLAPASREAIERELATLPPLDDHDDTRLRRAIALVLGSPDFQHH